MPGGSGSRIATAPSSPARQRLARLGQDLHVVARHRHRRRAELHRQSSIPAGFAAIAQPVSVCHQWSITGTSGLSLRPDDGVGIGPLAGEEQVAQRREVVVRSTCVALRILALDRPERRRRGEEALDPVLGDHPPEGAGVGRADRLALEDDRRRPDEQRRVADVGMPDHPADVRRRPEHVAGLDVVDVPHRPGERHHVAGVGPHHALGLAGGAGGVEDVERIDAADRHAGRRRRRPPAPRPSRGRGRRPARARACARCRTRRSRACAAPCSIAASTSGL